MPPTASGAPRSGTEPAAATMLLSTPELTSPIFAITAEGVRGGVMRRRERVVVWDLRSVVVALTASMGLASSVVVVLGEEDEAAGVFGDGAREDW